MEGYIYILSNPSMPGLIKVGKTTTHPSQRMAELHSTGVPTPFVLEFSAEVDDCERSERIAHHALSKHRVAGNREFFRISVKKALKLILPEIGDYELHDARDSHGIEELCEDIRFQEWEKERQWEWKQERPNADLLAKRQTIEKKIAEEEQKLRRLGRRPEQKFVGGLGQMLIFCYWPPWLIAWYTWLSSLLIFSERDQVTGWMCLFLVLGGYVMLKIQKQYDAEFERANTPFQEIDDTLGRLRQELKSLS